MFEDFKEFITSLAEWWINKQEKENEKEVVVLNNKRKLEIQKKEFDNILSFADSVIKTANKYQENNNLFYEEHPILDVIRILGKNLQTKYMLRLLKSYEPLPKIDFWDITFNLTLCIDGRKICIYDLVEKVGDKNSKTIQLKKDLVLPSAWNRDRLIDNISSIGKGRWGGVWKQHDSNHLVEVWLPTGVCWVNNGNHSITTGIAQGEGEIVTDSVYDISNLYKYIYCDGIHYRYIKDNSVLNSVKNVEFAAIFEIGRMMVEHGISY